MKALNALKPKGKGEENKVIDVTPAKEPLSNLDGESETKRSLWKKKFDTLHQRDEGSTESSRINSSSSENGNRKEEGNWSPEHPIRPERKKGTVKRRGSLDSGKDRYFYF